MSEKEARIFTRYLLNQEPSAELVERYATACKKLRITADIEQVKILDKAIQSPSLIPFLDAAFSFGKQNHLLRRKILVMLAILETSPEFYNDFRTRKHSFVKWIGILFRGSWAIIKMMTGKIILLFL
jgi:hypothetical protein